MTQEEIKQYSSTLMDVIRVSREELEKLQNECTHPETHIGKYSWRIGCIDDAIICDDCSKMIRFLKYPYSIDECVK